MTITGVCEGGNHVFVDVTVKGVTRPVTLLKADIMAASDDDFVVSTREQAVCKELRRWAARQGINTFAAARAAAVDVSISL